MDRWRRPLGPDHPSPGDPGDASPIRVGDALDPVLRSLGSSAVALVTLGQHWSDLVGPTLAAHSRPSRLDGGVLTVVVDQSAWATEFRYLAAAVGAKATAMVGTGQVTSVSVVVRRP